MDDPLQERTRRLLTDFLTFCAREPGVPESPPTSAEAELLRSLAARMQRQHEAFFSPFYGYQGNRVELVRQMADGVFSDGQNFNWGRLVLLLTFAGTLLNQDRSKATTQMNGLNNQMQVARDCQLIVDLLCNLLLRQHRSWLEAHDGWDGFCDFFRNPFPVIVWRRVLIKAFLTCIIATTILYIWKKF
ncbi:bcl-2-like protein 10 [Arvicola amphibius]|uniref:bcl-2-like protein 10 n=1 Tax=Arvicola amphibius TaxID=1047088 RepID=UPI0018E32108|nr:bcl-2-like protein 10 [Arvicola amphibius]